MKFPKFRNVNESVLQVREISRIVPSFSAGVLNLSWFHFFGVTYDQLIGWRSTSQWCSKYY